MNAALCRLLDRIAIQFAAARAPRLDGRNPNIDEARAFLESREFISEEAKPALVELGAPPYFSFPTPRPTPYIENNIIHGRLFRCERQWQDRPTIILLHGWNDVNNHYWRFPRIAEQINRYGMNAATLEAPYHFQRRPRHLGSWSNFLCPDILRTVQAAAQGIAEIHAFAEWLRVQGCPAVGLWGVSLGAWLAGLSGCHDARWSCVILVTPVAKLDDVIENVSFCKHIREAFQGQPVNAPRLNLTLRRPAVPRKNVLLIEAEHDLFIARESVEELWRAWGEPPIVRLREGHITAPGAKGLTTRIIRWAAPLMEKTVAK